MAKKFAKETIKEKNKRFKALFKEIKRLLKINRAGIFAIPNPITKQIALEIMDVDDLSSFNEQVQKNIEEKKQESLKEELQKESDAMTDEQKDMIKDMLVGEGDSFSKPDGQDS